MNVFKRIYRFYADGFRGMTVGRTLWLVIIIKLVVMFVIIRMFFMPDILGGYDDDSARVEAVRKNLSRSTSVEFINQNLYKEWIY